MNIDGTITSESVLVVGELLVFSSMVTGITVLLYFLHARRLQTIRLITNDGWLFARNSAPYLMNFLVCWYLSLAFEKLITSNRKIMNVTSQHYLASKIILNVTAVVTKQCLIRIQNTILKILLFVGYLILVATSDAMSHDKYEQTTVNVSMMLLFWLTVLILIAPVNAYCKLRFTEMLTWKRFSLVYGLVTSMCHSCLRTGIKGCVSDMILMVLVVHVQLIFLCITYFSDGQQLLRNIVERGTNYHPMVDSLDLYFTVDSILSRMNTYLHKF